MAYLGESIPKLGFGLMRLPMAGDRVDLEQTKQMVDLFLEKGFTYFDTAHGYLNGKSEEAARIALKKAGLFPADVRYAFAGDLLGQLIATSFGNLDLAVPLFGLYGACSTMGEAMGLGAMTVAGGFGDRVLAMASSHFATAEKQFRFPLAYGNQRPLSATWTVTGCGAVVIGAGTEPAADRGNGCGVRLPSTCGLARIAGMSCR